MAGIAAETGKENFSSGSFHLIAQHYYKCVQDVEAPGNTFSPVPYALLCRAIELELKSRFLKNAHLGGPGQEQIAIRFGHDLKRAYEALNTDQVLSPPEFDLLRKANEIYKGKKGFDYIQPHDAAHGLQNSGQVQFPSPNGPFTQAMSQIGQALQNGDLAGAQQALSLVQRARRGIRQP
jgi:hypothetical protein